MQAFTPFHPAIQYARRHDFTGFYEQEIEFRQQLKYPPLTRAALLTLKGRNEEKVRFSADHLRKELEKLLVTGSTPSPGLRAPTAHPMGGGQGEQSSLVDPPSAVANRRCDFGDLIVAGPAPAPLLRAETYYRYQLMLRTRQMTQLSLLLSKLMGTLVLPQDVSLTVDVDPVNLS